MSNAEHGICSLDIWQAARLFKQLQTHGVVAARIGILLMVVLELEIALREDETENENENTLSGLETAERLLF